MMNSVLALALAAQVVVANPLVRRQVSTSRAAPTGPVTVPFSSILTSAQATETVTIPSPTTYTLSEGPATTSVGGSDGSYWLCSFPGSGNPTGTYSSTLPEITEPLTESVFKRQAVTSQSATAAVATVTSIAETDVLTEPFPNPTVQLTSDFPNLTASPVPTGNWVSTYTVVGPETTAVIKCVRAPRRGGHHHGTGPVTWSGPVPTTGTFTSVIDTDIPTATLAPVPVTASF